MDEALRKGLICHKYKTIAPCQSLKFCGFVYVTYVIPTLCISEDKVTRALAFVEFLSCGSCQGIDHSFKRLTLSVVTGVLQSLVDAAPSHLGASFLRGLYSDLHSLKDPILRGTKAYYYTSVCSSEEDHIDLKW